MADRALRGLAAAAGAVAAGTAAAAAANAMIARRSTGLPAAIEAEQGAYGWDGGPIAYAVGGSGLPVLLLHSHNAAASSYEMRLAFHRLDRAYKVYAPDLPGYGRSERRRRVYFAGTYIRFLHDFIHDVIGGPAIVIASSVSAAHVLAAVAEDAHAFSHIVLVSPTGLSAESAGPPAPARRLGALARLPVWGQTAFNGLVSRRSIRWTYENLVYRSRWAVTYALVEYAWRTSHQPNAVYAPASFLSGDLWIDARSAYPDIRRPMLLVWGKQDRLNPYSRSAAFLPSNPGAVVRLIDDCGGAPYDEKPAEFADVVTAFLAEAGAPAGAGA